MSKQTSIEWYAQEDTELTIQFLEDKINDIQLAIEKSKLFEQAKQMHKDEIEEAYGHGQNNGYMYAHKKAITITKENYYSQTYGGNNE